MKSELLRAGLCGVAICLLVLVFGEIGARVFQVDPDSLITLDSCTGYKSIPGSRGVIRGPGGLVPIQINSAGFRDIEHTLQKPKGVYRVLFLGDSMTEATQVPEEETFARQLQKLADTNNLSLEVINMGVSSFGTAQEVLAYECYGQHYHPDLVVLAFNGGNVLNNYFRSDQFTPTFSEKDGHLVLDESYKTNVAQRLHQKKTLFPGSFYFIKDHLMFVRHLFFEMQNALAGRALAGAAGTSEPILGEFTTPYTPEWEAAWARTGSILARLQADTQKNNARMLVVQFPALLQMESGETPAGEHLDLEQPNIRITAIATSLGVPILNLYKPLLSAQKTAPVHWPGDPHLTAYGHTVVAKLLFDKVLYLRNK